MGSCMGERVGEFRYAVAVGANRGDRAANIRRAAAAVQGDGMMRIVAQARPVATAPVGGPAGQGEFLNGAWIVATALGPHQVLHRLQAAESAGGRARTVRWGPRTIDLDLILRADGLRVASGVLELPHPRFAAREFVLAPLAEIAGDWRDPCSGLSVRGLLERLSRAAPTAGGGR